jgi:hypothetical protein
MSTHDKTRHLLRVLEQGNARHFLLRKCPFHFLKPKNGRHFSCRGQAIYMDFMIGIVFLMLVVALYFKYLPRATAREAKILQEMEMDARSIASSLMNSGLPSDWNSSTVQRIGIVEGDSRLNATKLQRLAGLPYSDSKALLGSSRDFYVYFQKGQIVLNVSGVCGFGSPLIAPAPAGENCSLPVRAAQTTDVLKVERILIADNALARMVVLVWK